MHAYAALDPRIATRCDGSDIAQETLLRATAKFDGFRGTSPAQFQTWLLTIQENVLTDFVRRHLIARRRSVREEERLPAGDGSGSFFWHNFALPGAAESASYQMVAGERARLLTESIDKLPERQSTVIRLRFLEGTSLAEIADRLSISPEAVSSAIYRGLRTLKQRLPDILERQE